MGNSFLLIIVGLLLFYLVISDKWQCVESFAGCIFSGVGNVGATNAPANVTQNSIPENPAMNTFNSNWLAYGF